MPTSSFGAITGSEPRGSRAPAPAHGQHHAARVVAQHVACDCEQAFTVGVQVAPRARMRPRSDPAHARQSQGAEQAYPQPADVISQRCTAKRPSAERVMIIVQLLATSSSAQARGWSR